MWITEVLRAGFFLKYIFCVVFYKGQTAKTDQSESEASLTQL